MGFAKVFYKQRREVIEKQTIWSVFFNFLFLYIDWQKMERIRKSMQVKTTDITFLDGATEAQRTQETSR